MEEELRKAQTFMLIEPNEPALLFWVPFAVDRFEFS